MLEMVDVLPLDLHPCRNDHRVQLVWTGARAPICASLDSGSAGLGDSSTLGHSHYEGEAVSLDPPGRTVLQSVAWHLAYL